MRKTSRIFKVELMAAMFLATATLAPASAESHHMGTVTRSSSQITIYGTDQAQTVSVTYDNGVVAVSSDTGVTSNDCTMVDQTTVECSPSEAIVFHGYGGGDTFTTTVPVPTRLHGGDGRDNLSGSTVGDRIDGQRGNDTLRGRAGPDTLLGGPAMDALYGGAGPDNLDGNAGTDSCDGGSGNDTESSCES